MSNPFQAPSAETNATVGPPERPAIFVLAAAGSWLAAAYWAAITLLIGSSAAGSFVQIVMPIVLIVLYAWRGVQLFKGDRAAARRILWLHGVGGLMALLGLNAGGLAAVLHGIKVVIHIFGGVTAYLAQTSAQASSRMSTSE